MKSIIYRNPHLTARIITSLTLQILLVLLLRQPHQDSTVSHLGILVLAFAASVLLSAHRCLELSTRLMLGLWSLWPTFVFLATLLHLLGWNAWWDWLLRLI